MVMDYILNPLICTILCSKLTQNILPGVPYWVLAIFLCRGVYASESARSKNFGAHQ